MKGSQLVLGLDGIQTPIQVITGNSPQPNNV